MSFFKIIKSFLIIFCLSIFLNNCTKFENPIGKPPIEPNAMKRAQNNVREGKGLQLFKKNKKGGDFLFASSNPMWKATLDTLSFMSLANVDYGGGIIITDWYSEEDSNESIKITIRFLSNEIRADGMSVSLHKRTCKNSNCVVKKIKNDLIFDIKDKILRKAAVYKTEEDKKVNKGNSKKVWKDN